MFPLLCLSLYGFIHFSFHHVDFVNHYIFERLLRMLFCNSLMKPISLRLRRVDDTHANN